MFQKSFVINLPFKTDRLSLFHKSYPKSLPPVVTWRAIHGDTVQHPEWWTSGRGAWGCYRSHLQILEHCYNENVDSYIVFEDDAIFKDDFDKRLEAFMAELPEDWEQIYLGGQLLHEGQHPPRKINDQVYAPYNVNRTHCFAVHRRGYERLYKHLNATPFAKGEHIDHHSGRLHESGQFKVYCPGVWMVGQDAGPSNINGNHNSATYWIDPERLAAENRRTDSRHIPFIFLESSIDTAIELERRGWHRGHWQNEHNLDRGVCNAIAGPNLSADLVKWQKAVMPEAVREGRSCICLYHPTLTWSCVSDIFGDAITKITASDYIEAEQKLTDHLLACEEAGSLPQIAAKRNLIYHIWPRKGNGVWQWNVGQLLERIDQFNGVRSIAVVTSEDSDTLDDVREMFTGVRIDNWLDFPNDPKLGEVVTFQKLMETLPINDGSVTFRGHAKGVKYPDPDKVKLWTSMLYETCLDDPEFVSASLSQWPVTGPFLCRKEWGGEGGPKYGWHYAGAFYWFRNKDVLADASWPKKIHANYWGAELFPSNIYRDSEVGCLFGQNTQFLYDHRELMRMQEWLVDWKSKTRQKSKSISVVIPSLGRDTLRDVISRLIPQVRHKDEILVVCDGATARRRVDAMGLPARVQIHDIINPRSRYGDAQRNHGKSLATGDLVWFVDDDDEPDDRALQTIRDEMATSASPTMFKIVHHGNVIWNDQDVREGNVSGQMLVVPNSKDIPDWPVPSKVAHIDDLEWIQRVESTHTIRWVPKIIYAIKSHSRGVFRPAM